MRKNNFLNIAAALWMGVAALAMTACSSEDNFENNVQPAQSEVHTYSVCIPASFSDAQTRAVVPGTDPISSKENLVGQFMKTEKIMVYNLGLSEYANLMGDYTFLQPDADGATMANLTGELSFSGSVAEGQTLKLMYNHTNTSALELQYFVWDSDPLKIQYQPGTLAGLSNYDFAVADVTISAGGISGTGPYTLTTSAANFENQQSMFKFTFTGLPTGVGVQKLVVSSANNRIVTRYNPVTGYEFTIVPAVEISLDDAARTDNGAGVVYAAIRFQSGADDITFTVTGTDGKTYIATKHTTGFSNGKYYTATIEVYPQNVDLSALTGDYTAQNGQVLTGKLANDVKISIADGATVTLSDANINGDAGWLDSKHAGLTCEGDATIILDDGTTNTVLGFYFHHPGIFIPSGKTLTIKGGAAGTGILNVYGGRSGSDPSSNGRGAGIGAGFYASKSCGNIVIEGGDITATACEAAGIGGGYQSSCGDITIKGGTVHASSSTDYPGIGAGCENGASCGNITISGGNVTATSTKAAGIGCAFYDSTCGNITISGGTVNATGGYGAAGASAGIGGAYTNNISYPSNCGNILITGGTVTATGGTNTAGAGVGGAGIGSGSKCKSGTITIQGGSITATGGGNAAGIGAGIGGICGSISITGATFVDANKGTGGPYDIGIGSDLSETYKSAIKDGDTPGTVTIAAGITTSDGTKHYTAGTAANGYNKQ